MVYETVSISLDLKFKDLFHKQMYVTVPMNIAVHDAEETTMMWITPNFYTKTSQSSLAS